MINSRLRSLIRKEFLQIIRDPRTMALVLVMPIIQLLMLGYAATNDVRNVPMAVFDQDRSPAARRLLDAYRAADYFLIAHDAGSEAEMRDLIDSGQARVGLIIPPNYSNDLQGNGTAVVAFVLDGSDPTIASTALSAAQLIAQQHGTQVLEARLARRGQAITAQPTIEVRTQVWYNPDLVSAYFMVPGVIGMILYAITSILTATAIVRERERGTIEQLIVTPIQSWELIVGKLIPYVILAFSNIIEVLLLGRLLFGMPIRGDLSLILLLSGLFLVSGLGIGLLASTIANTQQEAMLTVFMTLLPSIFLSGFFFPLEAMPIVLQWFSYLTPLRYYLTIIRALLVKGVGFGAIQGDVVALALFGLGIMTLAAMRFRKRLD
ncbi:MAG: ABC transporter permease [Anaerolineales bacterium]|nr:ABC transporter permease [Anaerolineales bacterium]MCB8983650.1 ABC transporter permease [Ardenticatenaceae bacterium]